MNLALSFAAFAAGVALVIYCAEPLVKSAVGTSRVLGIPAFLVSVIFIGFDPENLALGATASYEGVAGLALGSVVGAAMVAVALAFGITALLCPMRFAQAPLQVLVVPMVGVLLLGGLGLDGRLSRPDGALLLAAYGLAMCHLLRLARRGLDVRPGGEVAETLRGQIPRDRARAGGMLVASLAGITVGGELLVHGARDLIGRFGLSDTVFGMTIVALLISMEELARELPAAARGRPDITFGNIVGSVLAFFLFNAGIIALVRPLPVNDTVLRLYLPYFLITLLTVTIFMARRSVPRWAGVILVLLYIGFFVSGYLT